MSDKAVSQEMAEFIRKIPFSEHLGIKVDSLEKGVARLSMAIRPWCGPCPTTPPSTVSSA